VIFLGDLRMKDCGKKMKNHPQKFLDQFKPSNPAISLACKRKIFGAYTQPYSAEH
jgi:hypothetical protein